MAEPTVPETTKTCRQCQQVLPLSAFYKQTGGAQGVCAICKPCHKTRYRLTHWRSSEYRTWDSARRRCFSPRDKNFHLYGGRGITMVERWRTNFRSFLADMGPRPSPSHTLDRIDNNGPYGPDNCRWAIGVEQHNNKRTNRLLEFDDRKATVVQWARTKGMSPGALNARLRMGWSVERALTEPLQKYGLLRS